MKDYINTKFRDNSSRTISNSKKKRVKTNNEICQRYPDFNMINRFGSRFRNIMINTSILGYGNVHNGVPRTDDVPLVFLFTVLYNKLNNIDLYFKHLYNNHNYNVFLGQTNINLIYTYVNNIKQEAVIYKTAYRTYDPNILHALGPGDYENALNQEYINVLNRYISLMLQIENRVQLFLIANDLDMNQVSSIGRDIWREKWLDSIERVNRILTEEWRLFRPYIREFIINHYNLPMDIIIPLELDYIGSTATGYKGPPKQRIQFNPELFDVDANIDSALLADYAINVDNISPDRNRIFARRTSITPLVLFCAVVDYRLKNEVPGIDLYDDFDIAIKSPDTIATSFDYEFQELLFDIRRHNPQNFDITVNNLF